MIKKPKNLNYCATVVEIKNIILLENCDNVVHTNIFGNLVVISKDIKVGDVGLFFPVETKLSHEFLSANNLYRDNTLNKDTEKKGYFEKNGRIKCVKFRQNKSQGFFIPLESIYNLFSDTGKLPTGWDIIGTDFDNLNGVKICEKYIPVQKNLSSLSSGNRNKKGLKKFNVLLDNQFKFHEDTALLGKNLHKINPDDIVSITTKLYGTSGISSLILCKHKLKWFEKILKYFNINIQETEYKNLYSSRRVIKNQYLYNKKDLPKHYYNIDIWELANNRLKEYLIKGQTLYYEIVGYIPDSSNRLIQKKYDYGCDPNEFDIYIYRITSTNVDGKVFEWSMKQVQDWG